MNKEEGFDNYMSRLLSPCKNCAAKDDELKYLRAEFEANKDKVYTKSEYDELGAEIDKLKGEIQKLKFPKDTGDVAKYYET